MCNDKGEMVLLLLLVIVMLMFGLEMVVCYNGYMVVDINGGLVFGFLLG